MAVIVTLIIVFGLMAYEYFRGRFALSLVTVFTTISGAIVAFGFYETAANMITGGSTSSKIAPIAQPLMFLVLFAVSFAIFQTIVIYLFNKEIELGAPADKAGRVICGAVYGLLVSGILITAASLAPLGSKIPYARFDVFNPNITEPSKTPLNPDGMVAGLFGLISRGGLSGSESFSVIHPSLPDEIFLNRLAKEMNIKLAAGKNAIEVPKKEAAWLIEDDLRVKDGMIELKSGYELIIARVGVGKKNSKFCLSQLRLICKPKEQMEKPFSGKAVNAYPMGYVSSPGMMEAIKLSERIDIPLNAFKESRKWIDFVFQVPQGYVPVLIAFAQDNLLEMPPMVDIPPSPVYFSDSSTTMEQPEDPNS